MARAWERLEHIYSRVKSAHRTLAKIAGKEVSVPDHSDLEQQISNQMDQIDGLMKGAMKKGWGSYPTMFPEKRESPSGVEYEVMQYQYSHDEDDEYYAGPVQGAVLSNLNRLMGRLASLDVRAEAKAEKQGIPEFVGKHADMLKEILDEMDEMRKDKEHPYAQKRTRNP